MNDFCNDLKNAGTSLGNYTERHPNVTIKEAADFCNVSRTTIRRAMKEYSMHSWKDDKGVIHIRTLDLMKFYRKFMAAKTMNSEKYLQECIAKRSRALNEYDNIRRTYDDQLEGETAYVSMEDVRKAENHVLFYDSQVKMAFTEYKDFVCRVAMVM